MNVFRNKYLFCEIVFCIIGLFLMMGLSYAEETPVTIKIEGVSGPLRQNVEAATSLPPGFVRDGQVDDRWLDRFVRRIPEKVYDALEPFGHYHSLAETEVVDDGAGHYTVLIRVDPGPVVVVRSARVELIGEGASEQSLQRLVRAFPLREGDTLVHQKYESGKFDLRLTTNNLGYLENEFVTQTIRVYPDQNVADIELILDTGPRFYFGDVIFTEEIDLFDEPFLRRFITFKKGDVFSHTALHRSRLNFFAANRFREVLMVPRIDEAVDRHVPVEVRLVPDVMQRLRPGVGYATNTGARLRLSYQHMNMLDKAHSLVSDLILAQKRQFFETSYTVPQPETANDNLIGTVGYLNEDIDTYETELLYTEIERAYGLGPGRVGSLYLRFFREDYEIGLDQGVAHVTMPGIRFHQRSYDNPLNPKSGFQYRIELRGGHDDFLSDMTLGQVLTGGNFIYPLAEKLTLHSRVEGALSVKDNDFEDIPATLRFFVGGDNSVRGYNYKSRGPKDENDDVIGGDSMLVGSIECEYEINDEWGLAIFYDIGSAFNAFNDIEFVEGAGVGLRYYTPIGPIKMDFANRVSEDHDSVKIHFSLGFDI